MERDCAYVTGHKNICKNLRLDQAVIRAFERISSCIRRGNTHATFGVTERGSLHITIKAPSKAIVDAHRLDPVRRLPRHCPCTSSIAHAVAVVQLL